MILLKKSHQFAVEGPKSPHLNIDVNDIKHSSNQGRMSKFKAHVIMEDVEGKLIPGRERAERNKFKPNGSDNKFSVNNLFNGFGHFEKFIRAAH